MTPFIALLLLLAATAFLCLVPFLPAFIELHRKSDAAPLDIIRDHDGNIRRFAAGLRQYLQRQLSDPALDWGDSEKGAAGAYLKGQFSDGTPFLLLRGSPDATETPAVLPDPPARRMIISHRPLLLPARATFRMDLFATEAIHGGEGSVYRAVLGDKEILLARGSTVCRWLHSEDQLLVEPESTLYGRASAERLIRLGEGCQFERLHAARIEFGDAGHQGISDAGDGAPPGDRRSLQPLALDRVIDMAGRRALVRGDLRIPPGSLFSGDLVVTGQLLIGEGAIIEGSVKSYKDMVLARGVQIDGSLVSGRSIAIGPDCRAVGPVVAEREITVETGARLGSESRPTTVCSPHLFIQTGVVAFGTVRAARLGVVISD